MSPQINHVYEFGEFRLETAERLLLRGSRPIPVTPRAFETLLVLVHNAGHAVEKDALIKEVWRDAFVEEANLARNIWSLRKALGDDQGAPRYIETVSKLGYRFIAPVTELVDEAPGPQIQKKVRTQTTNEATPAGPVTLPATTRRALRPVSVAVMVLLGLTATALAWLWPRPPATPASATPSTNFLTDGRFDDTAAYFTNQGQIYYLRYLTATRAETWTMNGDGTNPHRANGEIKDLLNGRFSPDGKKVIFHKSEDGTTYLADASGANEVALPFVVGNMDWSPDGSQFVYESPQASGSRGNPGGPAAQEIFLYTLNRRQSVQLTNNRSLDADPSFSPDGRQIAFVSDRDGNAEIYVMRTDGSDVRRITNHPAFDNYPVFSPDGTQIAFQSNREDEHVEVYLQDLNNDAPPKRLTHFSGNTGLIPKSWSADGTQLLLYTNHDGQDRIVLTDVDPLPPRLAVGDAAADLSAPRVSADGRQILYQARLLDQSLELRITDVASKSTRTVFKTAQNYPIASLTPAWSPDNSLIAFAYRGSDNSDIFTIRTDGSDLRNLTRNPLLDTTPIFSTDGKEIVFARDRYGTAQLYRMDLDGGHQRRVTDRVGYEMTPAFSPDGARLAFAGDRNGRGLDIFLLDVNNPQDERVLVARQFHDEAPAFSPDGRAVAFIAHSDGNPEIYLINVDGTGLVRLTHSKGAEAAPQFTNHGKDIVFASNRDGKSALYEITLR